jgi:hypothetical protein
MRPPFDWRPLALIVVVPMLYHDHFLVVMALPVAVMMPFLYHDGILSMGRYDRRDKADAGSSSKYQNKLTH